MEPPKALEADDAEDTKTVTWLLLVHHAANEIRAELSLPLDVDGDGKVAVWRERIFVGLLVGLASATFNGAELLNMVKDDETALVFGMSEAAGALLPR